MHGYPKEEVEECLAVRKSNNSSTWIAFLGDSNMRQKLEALTTWFLPDTLTYFYFLNGTQVLYLEMQPSPTNLT